MGPTCRSFFCFLRLAAGIWNVTGAVTLPPRVYGLVVTSYNRTLSSYGSSTKYARITAAEGGTVLPYVATAENGWHAVIVGDRVGWVSGKYSRIE